ncbi:hypothetical protein HYH03_009755 [Edaphochlamys debaryana]|uniref:Chlorophyll a-b binding protein, chloroplastic n=1 Tax=Edaphochlamys debaryana TaxID=47281 RepID=A0A836BWT7_9CHLO|nr:hypothetical protein HYH03_009755 [Edaphochlamys debaryana]|eukprot:KAG2492026.1 hypothetical protein HYH03_009755 [Edaphochlamys debaryana]
MLAAKSQVALGRRAQATRGQRAVCRASARPTWLPGLVAPTHLKGALAGDNGFDPLGLGQDESRLKWYVEAEKTNGRWAMMAVVGILGQELLGVTPKWWAVGDKSYDIDPAPLHAISFTIFGFLENKRFQGYKQTGTSGFINSFPFDPAGMNSPDMAVKEVKNGRLAMVAFIGFCVQALVSRTQPIEGLTSHLSDPFGKNITYFVTHLPETLAAQ